MRKGHRGPRPRFMGRAISECGYGSLKLYGMYRCWTAQLRQVGCCPIRPVSTVPDAVPASHVSGLAARSAGTPSKSHKALVKLMMPSPSQPHRSPRPWPAIPKGPASFVSPFVRELRFPHLPERLIATIAAAENRTSRRGRRDRARCCTRACRPRTSRRAGYVFSGSTW